MKRELNRTALPALVEGVDTRVVRQRKRYPKFNRVFRSLLFINVLEGKDSA